MCDYISSNVIFTSVFNRVQYLRQNWTRHDPKTSLPALLNDMLLIITQVSNNLSPGEQQTGTHLLYHLSLDELELIDLDLIGVD